MLPINQCRTETDAHQNPGWSVGNFNAHLVISPLLGLPLLGRSAAATDCDCRKTAQLVSRPVAGKSWAEFSSRRKEAAHLMENGTDPYIQRILDYLRDSVLLDPSKEIPLDQSLVEAGILDSYGIVDLLTFIEGEFGLAIPEKDITKEKMGSIRKMARYIGAGRVVQA
jgi:acyl carrier protein